jgi:4-hydroxybenzoate polyprenyltransferase
MPLENTSMKSIRSFFDLIKFEHTIFALPFAYLGMLLAARGWPSNLPSSSGSPWRWRQRAPWRWASTASPTASGMRATRAPIMRPLVTGSVSLRTAWTGTLIAGLALVLCGLAVRPAAAAAGARRSALPDRIFLYQALYGAFALTSWGSPMDWPRPEPGWRCAARCSP